jgi:hypothetical protein
MLLLEETATERMAMPEMSRERVIVKSQKGTE